MQAVLEQNLPTSECESWKVVIEKNVLRVEYSWCVISVIPHRSDIDYDTHWADVFAKILLRKGIDWVTLSIVGEENSNIDFLEEKLDSWVATFPQEIPPEGFEKAIGRGKRKVYVRNWTNVNRRDHRVDIVFNVIYNWNSGSAKRYWGYLG